MILFQWDELLVGLIVILVVAFLYALAVRSSKNYERYLYASYLNSRARLITEWNE